MPILSLLTHCLLQIGSARRTNDPSDPAHEMALRVLIVMLKDNSFSDDYPLIPRRRHHALLTAAQTALECRDNRCADDLKIQVTLTTRKIADRALAVAMALHWRVGQASPLHRLSPDLMQILVLKMFRV